MMSLPEYLDWLIKIGCGWLGWTVDQVNHTHLANIELAYEGKISMLKACFGSSEKDNKEYRKLSTIDDFKAAFGG
jgi:hypothetical protein